MFWNKEITEKNMIFLWMFKSINIILLKYRFNVDNIGFIFDIVINSMAKNDKNVTI